MSGNPEQPDSHDRDVGIARGRRATDHDLARRCALGDAAAERALFEAHRDQVHGILYRLLGGNREIEDALQETFFAIFRSLSSFRGESTLATWIARITVRVGMKIARARRDVPTPHLELVVEDRASLPSELLEAREGVRHLYELLEDVEPKHRAAYLLSVVDERSIREVAELTDASEIATKLRIWRTRKRIEAAARKDPALRALIGEEGT